MSPGPDHFNRQILLDTTGHRRLVHIMQKQREGLRDAGVLVFQSGAAYVYLAQIEEANQSLLQRASGPPLAGQAHIDVLAFPRGLVQRDLLDHKMSWLSLDLPTDARQVSGDEG